jgi:hypothetical protein
LSILILLFKVFLDGLLVFIPLFLSSLPTFNLFYHIFHFF